LGKRWQAQAYAQVLNEQHAPVLPPSIGQDSGLSWIVRNYAYNLRTIYLVFKISFHGTQVYITFIATSFMVSGKQRRF